MKPFRHFTALERRGIVALLLLTTISIYTPAIVAHYFPLQPGTDTLFSKEIAAFQDSLKKTPPPPKKHITFSHPRQSVIAIDINRADSTAWESLKGIGPVLAARIIRFRDKLGGFYAISQIRETYGLPDSTFNKIQPYLRLNAVSLKKLDLNSADEQTLAQHPYIRYKLARLIVLYRSNNGPFSQATDLLGIPLVDDSIYRKIEHYIKTEKPPI
ncbi:ComEA family DNA-binding protein [Chitinophaga silvisoli]|uniref:Helix-hairpin-helix domain-containing protein n=1 Tax=Chitinophaga silvisoli TaxID=2291814 RepID=A0A3E1P423_9BACT|nr:helix-hairpin-helix domain-containing protein [Chitinophaga silvisoli]RFM34922.1 helix-hairpin-helix domain-containing protein [Chitinophaga silvisoli]